MHKSPVRVVAGCALLIVVGLALATVTPSLGTVIAVAGIVLLGAYLIVVFETAWRGDQKRAWDPGSLYREDREERARNRK
jgi:hypothetical protein